jgi:hypothetical protein
MGYIEVNLNANQFGTADGGPAHVEPGPKKIAKLTRADRKLRDHIFEAHTRSTEHGKVFTVPQGTTDALKWHDDLHANGHFEWRREHDHE